MAAFSPFVNPAMPYARRSGTGWSSSMLTNGVLMLPVRLVRDPFARSIDHQVPPCWYNATRPLGLKVAPNGDFDSTFVRFPVRGSTVYMSRTGRPDMYSRAYGASSFATATVPVSES